MGQTDAMKGIIECFYELVDAYHQIVIIDQCNHQADHWKPERWLTPLKKKLAEEKSPQPLTEEEEKELQSKLNDISVLVKQRKSTVHKTVPLAEENEISNFAAAIQYLLRLFAQRKMEREIIPNLLERWGEPAHYILWVQFWRMVLQVEWNTGQENRVFAELQKITEINSVSKLNGFEYLQELAAELIHSSSVRNVERTICEILSSTKIQSLLPTSFESISQSGKYKTVSKDYVDQESVHFLRARVSKISDSDSTYRIEMYEVPYGRKGNEMGNHEGSADDIVDFCAEQISEVEKFRENKPIFQWVCDPNLTRVFYRRSWVELLKEHASVVVAAPRKAFRLKKSVSNRLSMQDCFGPNPKNLFKEAPSNREVKNAYRSDDQKELWVGRRGTLTEEQWESEDRTHQCEIINEFANHPFCIAVLCANEDPDAEWESVNATRKKIHVKEFLKGFSGYQEECAFGETEKIPRLLYQDPAYESYRSEMP